MGVFLNCCVLLLNVVIQQANKQEVLKFLYFLIGKGNNLFEMFVYGPHGHLSESESEETNLSDLEPEEMLRVNT